MARAKLSTRKGLISFLCWLIWVTGEEVRYLLTHMIDINPFQAQICSSSSFPSVFHPQPSIISNDQHFLCNQNPGQTWSFFIPKMQVPSWQLSSAASWLQKGLLLKHPFLHCLGLCHSSEPTKAASCESASAGWKAVRQVLRPAGSALQWQCREFLKAFVCCSHVLPFDWLKSPGGHLNTISPTEWQWGQSSLGTKQTPSIQMGKTTKAALKQQLHPSLTSSTRFNFSARH